MNFDASDLRWERIYQDEVTKSEIPPRCDVCNRLKWVLEYPFGTSVHLSLGALTTVTQETTCSSHPALIRGVRWPRGIQVEQVVVWRGGGGTSAQLTGIGPHRVGGDQVVSEQRLDLLQNRIQFAARTEESPFGDRFGIGDEDWIDPDTFRKWIEKCYTEHGGLCKTVESTLPSASPRWFVDTKRRCLVEAEPGQSYVALSYVWGAVQQYKTLREDLENLQQDGYLDRADVAIPRTIRDAIGLVPLLGRRYLWVDSLCLLQEDGDELWDQIHGMASIYANASMTIVAAQGENADFGLRGVKGVSQPRKLPDKIHTLRDGTQILSYGDGWFSRLVPTKYSHRAWTFQEYLFSRRRIIFKDDSVYWECGYACWEEEIAQVQCPKLAVPESLVPPGGMNLHPTRKRSLPGRFPNLMEYARLVRTFNSKQLTYPEDVPYAFAGVATTMSRSFAGGIVCGLPAMFFDVALLWGSHETCMKRRTPAQVQDEAVDVLPSWSWMGWEGRIDAESWKSGNDYLMHSMSGNQTHTVPTVVWFVRESVESDLIRVESTWCKYRTAIEEFGKEELPEGWTKHSIPLKDLVRGDYDIIDHPDGRPYAYRHTSGKKSKDGNFAEYDNYAFPIPLASASAKDELVAPKLFTPLLSGHTERTWFYLGKRGPDRSVEDAEAQDWHKIPGPFSVVDDSGAWAGILQSNFEGICDIEPRGQKIELVAISRGWCWEDVEEEAEEDGEDCDGRGSRSRAASRAGNGMDRRKPIEEWHYEQRPRGGEKYEWYNVLWIDRRKGTAYRKSVGRVERSAWEKQKRDSTFLKLG